MTASYTRSGHRIQTACEEGWLTANLRPTLCLWSGALVGGVSAVGSAVLGNMPSGHQLNDPLLLALSIGTVLRGFLYFNWINLAITIGYLLLLGSLVWLVLRALAARDGRKVIPVDANRAGKAAALISALPILIVEVDALQVLLWYAIATWLSMVVVSLAARQWAHRFR